MIKFASLLLFATATYCFDIDNSTNETIKEKIVGGDYVDVKDVPYIAQILLYKRQVCGGSIISDEWILTAAHCCPSKVSGLSIITGSSYRGQGRKRRIAKIIVHKDFDSDTLDNDIALIKLTSKIPFNEKQKAITISSKVPETDDKVKISGFGKEGEYLGTSSILKSAIVPVIDREICQTNYEDDEVTDNMFCAGNGETDACDGDSGGPAVIDGLLSGVVSSGMDCGSTTYPGVYVPLYRYRDWIASKTKLDI